MKITIKTTQQKVFQIEVEGSETISALKSKIEESQGHPTAVQKIIYSGKILTDDKSVDSCGIKEKDFLVLMVSKPKPTPTPTTLAPAPLAETSAMVTPAPQQPVVTIPVASSAEVIRDASQSESVPNPAPTSFTDPSTFLSGESLQSAINNMIEMGFPRDEVLRAMRASFNNADRAVEYLMTGIPAHLDGETTNAPAPAPATPSQTPLTSSTTNPSSNQPQNLFQLAQQQQQAGGGGNTAAGPGLSGTGGQLNLEALRGNPQIQQLREQMAQNPAMIQPLIQQLASQNPAIAQMIAQNPEALFQLLGVEFEDDGGEGEHIPPGAHVVSVTEEERAAIQRLEDLGFPRQAVLEAYFACDKNEELAANYLFESRFDD
ncbi:hypothetical protein B0H34DRAFT_699163 [Crassisporium funariophilum]|nr:hypothetical protein B0H34DRAFT_699163 [Crassisporium funariophilum]